MAIFDSINELIGNTPIIRLNRLCAGLPGRVAVKLEFLNPGGSVKDRPALAMIEAAEAEGLIDKETSVIEPSSGNTGIALAQVCAVKGYRLIITMPESMSVERQKIIRAYGAELELTPASEGMRGALQRAKELSQRIEKSFIPSQFENPSNPESHRRGTADEIWRDTEGKIDAFVAGVGTGGTLTGVGSALREKKPEIGIYAVEPADSPVLSGGKAGPHKIQGIGAGFVPEILDTGLIDEVLRVESEASFASARRLSREEGIFCGISSGAAVHAALGLASRASFKDKLIVTILASGGERYLSTPLYDFEEES